MPACHRKWGDFEGHHAVGERACLRCSYLASARQRLIRFRRNGGQLCVDAPMMASIVEHYSHTGDMVRAVERALIESAPSIEPPGL